MNVRWKVALGFLGLIALGAALLSSPWARADGAWGGPLESVFMAFSAVCVTGLSVMDVAEFSRAGQILLLVLVETGCLGLMTCGTFLLIAVGRRISLSREFSLMDAYGTAKIKGLRSLICWTVGSMLAIEAAGAAVLWFSLRDVYSSVFYSIMGFCNAGFSLEPDSLAKYGGDRWFVLAMALETILGGIGFLVIYNLCTCRWGRGAGRRGRLSLHAKVVLKWTGILLVVAFAGYLAAEWNNTLAPFGWWDKLTVGFYQAVTPRTCGFTVVPVEDMTPLTRLGCVILMYIGGGPGSAAAGMKVTTFAVLLHTCAAMCRGDGETTVGRHSVPAAVVRESIVIFMAIAALTATVAGALLITEADAIKSAATSVESLFFEAVSAITTTGLSIGDTTANLSSAGKCVLMCAMFAGRLGALTVVLMIGGREEGGRIRRPAGEIIVG